MLEPHKLAEIESREGPAERKTLHKPFGEPWDAAYFVKWATIWHALRDFGLPQGGTVLDIGAGTGWTSAFLAESGYAPTALDIAPGNARTVEARAARCGLEVQTVLADMDGFDLGRHYDAAHGFDAH